ncbi:hypothetical protein J6590_007946 [Homalodisca vitripennis]|nr:hypothetical protein J6590_007946 [Homalodisca vitripennis]
MKLNVLAGYDLGASCDYDEDCIADHSYCRNQQVCQCRIGFQPSPDGITCLATSIKWWLGVRGVPLELELFQISAPLLERSGAALRDSRNSSSSNLIYSYNYSLGASVELSAVAYNLLTNQNKPVSVSVGVLT